MSITLTTIDLLILALGLCALNWALKKKKTSLPLPPGPKPRPLIGNLLDLPKTDFAKTYTEWGHKYGPIAYADAAGQPIIIINDAEIANELLDKKSAVTSDRPVFEMAGELAGFKRWAGAQGYGPRLRESRKYMHRAIGTRDSLEKFSTLFENETHKFLRATLRDPDNVQQHIRHSAGSMIMFVTYGYEPKEKDDPIINIAESTLESFSLLVEPGAYMVDFIPLLKYLPAWFPGAGFHQTALNVKKDVHALADIPFQYTMREMGKGVAPPSFVTNNMQGATMTETDIENLKWSATSLFAGGADTTVSALYTFYLAMTLFPDAQRKAQEEIDRVIGADRLPTLADRDNLPYVNALHSEIYRWRPVAPTGLPHRAMEADTYRGYYIPKGSIIIANIWQMLHDPSVYSNPELFTPERFLATEGKPAELDPRECAFGFGRRICPGKLFADATVWLSIAMALSAFRISKVVENGVEVTPSGEYTKAIISHPEKFKCSIKPRSAQAEALVFQS
ncbi:cytochrome P450 [Gloeopeniophorella convolvens]|nr:cytochrome P450 [Gloeopeniophorella convolvens]